MMKFQVSLPDELGRSLKQEASRLGLPVSTYLRFKLMRDESFIVDYYAGILQMDVGEEISLKEFNKKIDGMMFNA